MKYKLLSLLLFVCFNSNAQQKPTQEWLDQKYSMFIHFGIYSEYGGVYMGKPVKSGYSEQIQSFAGIFSDWYAQKALEFNPIKWNADSIVTLAKDAGMKSIVFTSKHHDGFCMYQSKYTKFNIVEATPYRRDIMKELSDACRRGGIDFGVYFSLIDWHFPQAYPISSHNADPLTDQHYEYNLKQVDEIMTNYGSISEIWFDMGALTPQQSKGLYELVNRLQPQCMISGRLGNDFVDFSVMADNEYPSFKLDVPWQTAASVFDETWGYRSWQERGNVDEKVSEKVNSLINVISRGGNYLLNIGPRGDGSVVEFERELLHKMGKWININKEAIYGTKGNPLSQTFSWGEITTKENTLYLFINEEYKEDEIEISGFEGTISRISNLATGEECKFRKHNKKDNTYRILVPQTNSQTLPKVLKVTFNGGIKPLPRLVVANNKSLTITNSTPVFGHSSLNYYAGYKSLIGYDWSFRSGKKQIEPEIIFTENEKGKQITVNTDGEGQVITLDEDKSWKMKPKYSVQWGQLYTKTGKGVFGYVEEENQANINQQEIDTIWKKVEGFVYDKKHELKLFPRQSVLYLQEINSSEDQEIAVEIGSGNAAYILLNGQYLTAHFSPDRINYQKETVLLPLRKGNNQLVIKFYNGFEEHLNYSIKPLNEWNMYSKKLNKTSLRNTADHTITIRLANPPSAVTPLRMNNIKIKL